MGKEIDAEMTCFYKFLLCRSNKNLDRLDNAQTLFQHELGLQ
jgi:hypothetical protein